MIWIIVIFLMPFIGILAYILMRPKVTAQDVQMMAAAAKPARRPSRASRRPTSWPSSRPLKDAGTITDAEFEDLKAKLMAS